MTDAKHEGFPEDGAEYNDGTEPEKIEGEPEPKLEPKDPTAERFASLEQQISTLTAALNAKNAAQSPAPKKDEPEPDWEKLMFEDTKGAVKMITEKIRKEVATELTTKYQDDQNSRDFWNAFYHDHPDLKDDDDLVRATLNSNMTSLGAMKVKDAGDKLAELTRTRILRYTGGKLPSGKKAHTEGAQPPSKKPDKPEPPKVATLSDLLKARRAKRNKGTAA